jgi:hypothetical protein
MSLKKILQAKLLEKHYLSVNDVMQISKDLGHYYDTARRKMETKDTPFAKKIFNAKGHIAGWALIETASPSPIPLKNDYTPRGGVQTPEPKQDNLFNLAPVQQKIKPYYQYEK